MRTAAAMVFASAAAAALCGFPYAVRAATPAASTPKTYPVGCVVVPVDPPASQAANHTPARPAGAKTAPVVSSRPGSPTK